MRRHKRRAEQKKRFNYSWTWTLYTNSQGKVPKDLGELIGDVILFMQQQMPQFLPPNLPDITMYGGKTPLDGAEVRSVAQTLRLYVEHGLGPKSRLPQGRNGVIKNLGRGRKSPYYGLFEIRLANTSNNPRFIYGRLEGQSIVILHGFEKRSQKTPSKELDKAKNRFKRYQE